MRPTSQSVIAALLLGTAGVWIGLEATQTTLLASGGRSLALEDIDGDGLDDLLEFRIGSNPYSVDSDADTLSDLEEMLLGTDPLIWDDLSKITPSAGLYADAYAQADSIYLSVNLIGQTSAVSVEYSMARQQSLVTVTAAAAQPYLVAYSETTSSRPGWYIQRATYAFPRSWFESELSSAFAVTAIVDGIQFSQMRMFTHVDHILSEVRFPQGSGRQGSSTPTGGLVPLEPSGGGEPPYPGNSDEVCVQTLQPIGSFGGGRVAYRVSAAGCAPMASATCFTGCSTSIEDVLIGIDIIGLLGG
jgi:hypothetical protein